MCLLTNVYVSRIKVVIEPSFLTFFSLIELCVTRCIYDR